MKKECLNISNFFENKCYNKFCILFLQLKNFTLNYLNNLAQIKLSLSCFV